MKNIDEAMQKLLDLLNAGIEDMGVEKATTLNGYYGPGCVEFLRGLALGYGDNAAFFSHDDPQCAIDGPFAVVTRGVQYVFSAMTLDGQQIVLLSTSGDYIDHSAIFVFGSGAGYRKPKLSYSMGDKVEGEYL